MQLGVLRHAGLNEEDRLGGIHPGCQPIDDHVPDAFLDDRRGLVMSGERMPVGDEEEALVFVLKRRPSS